MAVDALAYNNNYTPLSMISCIFFIEINLFWTKANLTLHIKDNGVGFNNKITSNPTHGNGIKNIHKRVKDCGGKVSFYNAEGANIFIEIPLMA